MRTHQRADFSASIEKVLAVTECVWLHVHRPPLSGVVWLAGAKHTLGRTGGAKHFSPRAVRACHIGSGCVVMGV